VDFVNELRIGYERKGYTSKPVYPKVSNIVEVQDLV